LISLDEDAVCQLQGVVRPAKGKDAMLDGMPSSVRRSPGSSTSSSSSRSIAIPSINQRHPIVPCHGSVEGFNQVMPQWWYFSHDTRFLCLRHPTALFSGCPSWAFVRSSGQILLPRYLMNGLRWNFQWLFN